MTLSNLKMPLLRNLKSGDNFFGDRGKSKITSIYPQPNENNLMFQAMLDFDGCDKTPFNISFTDKIYVLPYAEQPIAETERFNESKNEILLSPYVIKDGRTVSVYWYKALDAADYIISLYKKTDRQYIQSIYHLKDSIVDRNEGFLVIDDLLGDGYIITVKAENRNGEVIALSRGIKTENGKTCFPQYWR